MPDQKLSNRSSHGCPGETGKRTILAGLLVACCLVFIAVVTLAIRAANKSGGSGVSIAEPQTSAELQAAQATFSESLRQAQIELRDPRVGRLPRRVGHQTDMMAPTQAPEVVPLGTTLAAAPYAILAGFDGSPEVVQPGASIRVVPQIPGTTPTVSQPPPEAAGMTQGQVPEVARWRTRMPAGLLSQPPAVGPCVTDHFHFGPASPVQHSIVETVPTPTPVGGGPNAPPDGGVPKPPRQPWPPCDPGSSFPPCLNLPQPTQQEVDQHVERYMESETGQERTIQVVVGRVKMLKLKETPKGIYMPRPDLADYVVIQPDGKVTKLPEETRGAMTADGRGIHATGKDPVEITLPSQQSINHIGLLGKAEGTTVLNLWFAHPDHPQDRGFDVLLSYLVVVIPDPNVARLEEEKREREIRLQQQRIVLEQERTAADARARTKTLEATMRLLEKEINTAFPDSAVQLALVGDQVVVRGETKDAIQAVQILRIVADNAPRRTQVNPKDVHINFNAGAPQTQLLANGIPSNLIPGRVNDAAAVEAIRTLLNGRPDIVNLLNIPGEQQVELMVTVAEVNRTASRSIGVNFTIAKGEFQFGQLTGGLITPASIASNAMGAAGGGISSLGGNLPTSIDNGSVLLAIQALRTLNFARTLAEPNLTTLNGHPASFRAGGEFPVPNSVVTPGGAAQSVTYLPFGVELQFVPYITDRDRIRLEVHAAVSTRSSATTAVSGASVPSELDERTFTTTVDLRDGQTLTVAGLIDTSFGGTSNRVPFFGDLPVIGRLFGSDQVTSSEQELMILVTPVLVHPLERCKTPALPGSDLFEPGDIEFFLGGHLEGHRTEDYRSCVRTDYARQAAYCNCENLYIIGPKGPTYGCCSGRCCPCPAPAVAQRGDTPGAAAGANAATAVGQRDAKTAAADGTEETKTR